MADQWVVKQYVNNRERTAFQGTEDDARNFVRNNFPRVHVEAGQVDSGQPDAVLFSPDGDREVHYAPDYVHDSGDFENGFGPHPEDDDYDDDDDDNDDGESDEGSEGSEDLTDADVNPAKKTTAPSFGRR